MEPFKTIQAVYYFMKESPDFLKNVIPSGGLSFWGYVGVLKELRKVAITHSEAHKLGGVSHKIGERLK